MQRLVFLMLVLMVGWVHATEIKGVRSWREPPYTRIVFDLSGAVPYRVFTMRSPHRVVIDFDAARASPHLVAPKALQDYVEGMRHAAREDGGTRVVLDLARPVTIAARMVPPTTAYGYRVELDLLPAASTEDVRPDPIATLAAVQKASAAMAERPAARADSASTASTPSADPASDPIAALAASLSTTQPAAAVSPAAAVAAPRQLRDVIVAIDAGHGGADVGAIGPSGVYEKDITLAVARELAAIIDRQPGMRAAMTRDGDRYLNLRERMNRARAMKADLFLSIHADAFRDRRVRGSSVYVLSRHGASSEAAKWLAEKENAADLVGGVSLDDKDAVLKSVLLDLSQNASMEASMTLANHVLGALRSIGPVHRKQVQHAGFMVLKSPDIPSVLVETAFISNPTEEKRLRDRNYRRKLAEAIYTGVLSYFDDHPPNGTRLALARQHKVARGDTLSGIASRYEVSVNSLRLANKLPSETVRAGEVLRIP
ncbi:MAG: N-acetylmuramoyl-L-alanine amidase [Gammaproteobacteria bacterium]